MIAAVLGLAVALPPLGRSYVLLVCLGPLIRVLPRLSYGQLLTATLAVAATFGGCIPIGLLRWGAASAIAHWLPILGWFAAWIALARFFAERLRVDSSVAATISIALIDLVFLLLLGRTPLLAAALGPEPEVLRVAAVTGLPALDALLVALNALLAGIARLRSPARAAALVAIALAAIPTGREASSDRSSVNPEGGFLIGVVQPNVSSERYADTGVSLYARMAIERDLDELTSVAVAAGADVVIWPENGDTGPVAQVASRISRIRRIIRDSDTTVFATGPEHRAGLTRQGVFQINAGGVVDKAYKTRPASSIEDGIEATPRNEVLVVGEHAAGILVCHDGLYLSSYLDVLAFGANLTIVTADHTSLGLSSLQRWHVAHIALFQSQIGVPVIIVSNAGPSYVIGTRDNSGDVERILTRGQRGSGLVQVDPTSGRSPVAVILRQLVPVVFLLPLLLVRDNRQHSVGAARKPRRITWWGVVILAAASGSHLGAMIVAHGPTLVVADLASRWAPSRFGSDRFSRFFVQGSKDRCGHAVSAFVAARLGDTCFEEDVVKVVGDGQMTLLEMKEFFLGRGFFAVGLFGGDPAARIATEGGVAIMHLSRRHYVAVWATPEGLYVFDPAIGTSAPLVGHGVLNELSGYWLHVTYR